MAMQTLLTCYPFMRYATFFFNLIFWIMGVVLFAFSIWALADPGTSYFFDADNWLAEHIRSAAILVLLISLVCLRLDHFITYPKVMMLVGFLGCCGAMKESRWMLGLFFVCLFIIFAALFGIGVGVLYRKDLLEKAVEWEFYKEVEVYRRTERNTRGLLALAEMKLTCCGVSDQTCRDYLPRPPPNTCDIAKGACQRACTTEFFKTFGNNMAVFGAVVLTIALFLLLGMMFALCLICGIREFEMYA